MNLHVNKTLFRDAILATSQAYGIREAYVEKDYWVTLALHRIFHSALADQAVFKGGTALSKCHKVINRFSEDVDLVVLRGAGETDSQLKQKIRSISKIVADTIPEITIEGLTNKMGNIRKTVHAYEKHYSGVLGQVREHIVLEITWLGHYEPYTQEKVTSYIADMMQAQGQQEIIKQYSLQPFTVQVLSMTRTLCEKIMSLVRFSRQENPYSGLSNKIRHIYDIHLLLKHPGVMSFFESGAFDEMLVKVGKDDIISFKNNNLWLQQHPATALIFEKPEETWDQIKTAYRTVFKELVMGEFPEETDLIDTLKLVAARTKAVRWELKA